MKELCHVLLCDCFILFTLDGVNWFAELQPIVTTNGNAYECEYEKSRAKNIACNEFVLRSLNLHVVLRQVHQSPCLTPFVA